MGNQQSQEKTKLAQYWAKWTAQERQHLEGYLNNSNEQKWASFFQKELGLGFPKQSVELFLETAHDLIKTKPSATATYRWFQQFPSLSLETFVTYIVQSSVPLWFGQSGLDWKPTNQAQESRSLVHYLLYHAEARKKTKENEMSWLNETPADKQEEDGWKVKVTSSPSKVSSAEFESWATSTPAFLCLVQLAAEHALLQGQDVDVSKRRLDHLASPAIHSSNNKKLFGDLNFSRLMNPYDYFMLTLYMPASALSWSDYERTQRKVDHDVQHELLFSSRKDGTSWQVFVSRLVGQGATLILLKSKDGNVFGGYADEAFELKTDWFGNSSNFLFRLGDSDVWDGVSGTNDHYQYLCWGKKTFPNGLGMGGQFDYAGLWVDADFLHGHSRAGPLCTTYSSPQLSADQSFLIDEVEGR
jgi:hypothetical protein